MASGHGQFHCETRHSRSAVRRLDRGLSDAALFGVEASAARPEPGKAVAWCDWCGREQEAEVRVKRCAGNAYRECHTCPDCGAVLTPGRGN